MPDPNFIAPEALPAAGHEPGLSAAPLKPTPEEQISILPTRKAPIRAASPKKGHRAEAIMILVAALVLIAGGFILLYFSGRR